jgi:hypothetical protein
MNIYYLTQIYIPYKVSVTKFNIYIYIYIYIYRERERERESNTKRSLCVHLKLMWHLKLLLN